MNRWLKEHTWTTGWIIAVLCALIMLGVLHFFDVLEAW